MSQSDDNGDLEAQIREALGRRRPAPPPPPAPRIVLTPGQPSAAPARPADPAAPAGTGIERPAGMVPDPETRLSQPVRAAQPSRPQARAAAPATAFVEEDPQPAIPPSPGQALGRIETAKMSAAELGKKFRHPFFAGRRHLWPLLILPIASVAIILSLFWFMNSELDGQGIGDLAPLVEADPAPIKVRPLEEGGMEIPDQDREIFNTLDGSSSNDIDVEQLVPPPEEPVVPPPPPQPASATAETATISVDENGLPVVSAPDPAVQAAETATDVDAETAAVAAALAAAAASAAADPAAGSTTVPAEAVTAVETAALPAGAFRVQLAAVRSEADAHTVWGQLQEKLPDLLGDFSLHVERIDLGGEQGVFYRVQAAPLADRESAQKLCGNLAARGQDCLVVHP
jgi:cell division septation protein DedD